VIQSIQSASNMHHPIHVALINSLKNLRYFVNALMLKRRFKIRSGRDDEPNSSVMGGVPAMAFYHKPSHHSPILSPLPFGRLKQSHRCLIGT
jgi:hypothetical protein